MVGDELGLYRGLAAGGAQTSTELARRTLTHERYVREWLNAHAASGFVEYHADSGRYELSAEQAMMFADEESPAFVVGGFPDRALRRPHHRSAAEGLPHR